VTTDLDERDCEELARAVRIEAAVDPEAIERSVIIARGILGPDGVEEVPHFSTPGVLARVKGRRRIFIRKGVSDANFIIAHELGHWALARFANYESSDIEEEEKLANRIGAAIVAPAPVLRAAHQHHGESLRQLALDFDATQSMVWLRLGEVLGDERALVTLDCVRVRSRGAFAWDELAVRRWAQGRAPLGVKKTRLMGTRYDSGRIVLKAS
jgi:IrrE N-terminal-like domain